MTLASSIEHSPGERLCSRVDGQRGGVGAHAVSAELLGAVESGVGASHRRCVVVTAPVEGDPPR